MFEENLHIFLNDFGTKISFTLLDTTVIDKDSDGNDLLGIFDNSYSSPELGFMTVLSSDPQITCIEADVKKVIKGASVTVKDKTFKVLSNTPDGTGFAIIKLSKQ